MPLNAIPIFSETAPRRPPGRTLNMKLSKRDVVLAGLGAKAQPRLPWSAPKTRSIKCGEWQRGEISDSRQSGQSVEQSRVSLSQASRADTSLLRTQPRCHN